jgi:tRNA pseudouridine38-40 synthase
MPNFKLVLAYDGTDFSGWQRQPDERTLQGVLEEAVFKITRRRASAHGAGRTDAGVHARGQVASIRLSTRLEDEDFLRALNAVLPWDLKVVSLERAAADFDARRSALAKIYQYRIVRSAAISPFDFRYALHWPYPLDVAAMRKAARLVCRTADFTAFSSNRDRHPLRTVTRSEFRKRGDELVYTIEGRGFLRYMVRTIVGTLLEIGRGRSSPDLIDVLFARRDRRLAGPTAPAKGLCLVRVDYGSKTRPMSKASSSGFV